MKGVDRLECGRGWYPGTPLTVCSVTPGGGPEGYRGGVGRWRGAGPLAGGTAGDRGGSAVEDTGTMYVRGPSAGGGGPVAAYGGGPGGNVDVGADIFSVAEFSSGQAKLSRSLSGILGGADAAWAGREVLL